jgi:putative NADPH-quinone reductase
MSKGLIIIADSNAIGMSHKLIAPTIKLLYIKRGFKCDVIDLHSDEFNPMSTRESVSNKLSKHYKHLIKTADHIHFVTSVNLGGISPGLEGFFEQVLTNGFAYNMNGDKPKSRLHKKEVYFYLQHSKRMKTRFNSAWLRLKFSVIPTIFKTSTIFQSDLNWGDPKVKNKKIKKVINSLISKLFKDDK